MLYWNRTKQQKQTQVLPWETGNSRSWDQPISFLPCVCLSFVILARSFNFSVFSFWACTIGIIVSACRKFRASGNLGQVGANSNQGGPWKKHLSSLPQTFQLTQGQGEQKASDGKGVRENCRCPNPHSTRERRWGSAFAPGTCCTCAGHFRRYTLLRQPRARNASSYVL